MVNMENSEEVMQILERFTRLKQKEIPKELDDYLQYVAKTGDTVFKWSSLKYLFREKLLNVIKHFHDTTPRVDEIPQYPNVDPFNYESMKSSLLERLELFNAAPFTIQRLCELLIDPRKQYSRIDKFMRALEKNILVVSTIEPGRKRTESENGDSLDSAVNGDLSLDVNVDIDMENESIFNVESQNGNGTSAITAAPTPDSTSDSAVTAEIRERPVTHSGDDDILPNPKKPKLDLDVEDAEALADTKADSAVTKVEEDTHAESAEPEKKIEKAADVDMQELEENKENLNVETDEKQNVIETSVVAKKLADEKKETDETNSKKSEEAGAAEEVSDKLQSEEHEETEVDAAIKGESEKKAAEVQNTTPDDEEKVIKKQEVENKEKPALVVSEDKDQNRKDHALAKESDLPAEENTKPEDNVLAKEGVLSVKDEQKPQAKENVLLVEDEEKPKECLLAEEDEKINMENELGKEDVLSAKEEQKPQEALVKEAKNSDEVEQKAKECSLAKERLVSGEDEKQQAAEPTPVTVKTAAQLEKTDKTVSSVDGQKEDDKEVDSVVQTATATGVVEDATKLASTKDALNIPEAATSNSDDDKSTVVAESKIKASEEVNDKQLKENPATEEISTSSTPAAADKTENESATADEVLTSATEATSSENAPTVAATDSLAIDAEATPSVELAVIVATTPSSPTLAATASTPPIVITPPTLALNDHPMEEHTDVTLDDIAVAESASPTSLTAEVEEVTMAESSSGGSAATAMATDVTEPAKDEPAGMEVDDTSQEEAMDQ